MPGRAGAAMAWWPVVLSVAAWILVSAKAHGRQVRIEREQQGVFKVDFGGQNPAAVEAIWRMDRRVFWPCLAVLSLLLGGSALFAGDWAEAALAPPAAFALSFMASGIASWVRMARLRKGPLPWRRRALLGSASWWLAAVAAGVLAFALTVNA